MKKFLCVMAAVLVACTAAVGCGEKKEDNNEHSSAVVKDDFSGNISSDDLPYGAKVTELKPENDSNVKVMIGFDNRYFGGDSETPDYGDVYKLSDFVAGMNTNDHDLLKSCYYEGYLEYAIEGQDYANVDEYLDAYVADLESRLGEGFEIDYIDISNCYDETDSDAKTYFELSDGVLKNIAGEEALSKVTSRKYIEIGGYTSYSTENGVYQFTKHLNPNYSESGMYMAVYCIDGKYYLF